MIEIEEEDSISSSDSEDLEPQMQLAVRIATRKTDSEALIANRQYMQKG